ncbi:HNH endonuclease [Rhodococcus sp. 1168]|uniref:HNH endonuclease n=1 Tax=Rhodococcus sp. 1168 TaxID=2018041 RepID=UPI000B5AF9A6|nr:HNH endonuclease [Rhodococcus sp. 1168]
MSDSITIDEYDLKLEYERVGDCWLWTGPLDSQGYAQLTIERKRWQLHRLIYTEFVGPIPPNKRVKHLCENRGCLRDTHLSLAIPKQRIEKPKKIAKPRYVPKPKRTHCSAGHLLADPNVYYSKTGKVCRRCKLAKVGKSHDVVDIR